MPFPSLVARSVTWSSYTTVLGNATKHHGDIQTLHNHVPIWRYNPSFDCSWLYVHIHICICIYCIIYIYAIYIIYIHPLMSLSISISNG